MPETAAPPAPLDQALALGLTSQEYDLVVEAIGREPRPAELAMYSVMWSEHCSYKSSRAHLGRLPTDAPWVVVGPGENAGVVDLGDGWLAAIRIESHNHPSFIEPYQGAATGVGGILRDIFTMGARPVAVWDALRFGPLEESRNRFLFGGVVGGVAGYGNAVGVPTVGGEVRFDPCYSTNPLVNVMALGVMPADRLVLARASGEGNLAVLLGAATGRDGIGGVSLLASSGFGEAAGSKRPSVQVGDPFEEKRLMEACLELYERGLAVGVQDLGGAGLTCAASETAARAGTGMELHLERVPRREPGMDPAEVLTSESQERMLAVVRPVDLDEVLAVAAKWEVSASTVGRVRSGGLVTALEEGRPVAEVPAVSLSEGPVLRRPAAPPEEQEARWADQPDLREGPDPGEALLALLDSPTVADKSWIYEQYDHMLFLDTVVGPGHDGTLLRLEGTGKALAASTDGDGRTSLLDPRRGAARSVYEAALNVAVTGARPLAAVDNLNFGSPERPAVMWQFREAVEGIAEACRALGVPVVGGNVSFYNETEGRDIHPTPVIGMLGLADPMPLPPPRLDAAEAGMELWLLGPPGGGDFAGSEYAAVVLDHLGGRPGAPDPAAAAGAVSAALALARRPGVVLHDLSDGGLAVAVAEVCILSGTGARLAVGDWRELFSEEPHRVLATVPPGTPVAPVAAEAGVTARAIGDLGGDRIRFGSFLDLPLGAAARTWREALPRRMA